jgi:predicted AlkP superfamily phosphohydrolase/phosphomutase/tetratricopeptide (TPR) repeat protein
MAHPPEAAAGRLVSRRRVLLVGWDAADWGVIQPLLDAGHMPHLARLLERGVMGNLLTLQPMLSPMLWTSIATGKRPSKHGVHGFAEVSPDSGTIRPISSHSRTTKAIWNILHQQGKTCHVIGWWPSHPAEPLRGAMVSDVFQKAVGSIEKPWPLPPGTVHPPELAEPLADLRVHPQEIEGDMLRAFVPRAPEIDQKADSRLGTLATIVAECASVQAAATHVLATRRDWDFCAVYFDAIDHVSHGFMRYHPPRLAWVSPADQALYADVVGGAYVFHDSMLGVLLELAGDDVTVVLMSDHGFHANHLRPRDLPNEPAGPAAEHRPYGIFVAAGPGIRRDQLVHGGSLLDVTPTLLTLFDLPVGRDMDGRPLLAIYEQPPPVSFIDSWDDLPGDAARLPATAAAGDADAAVAVMRQLADLGYIDHLPDDRRAAVDQTVREARWNLARSLADEGRLEEAAAIVTDLWDRWPDEGRFGVALLRHQLDLGRPAEARATFALLDARKAAAMTRAAAELRTRLLAIRDAQGLPAAEAGDLEAGIDVARVPNAERQAIQRLRARAARNAPAFAVLEGKILAAERRFPEALAAFERAGGAQESLQPSLILERADVLLRMRKLIAAAAEFGRVLELDPLNVAARYGLARTALLRGDPARAAAEARAAIGLHYQSPRVHLLAGFASWRAGDTVAAERFLRSAVELQPVYPVAHRILAGFLARERHDYPAAIEHRRLAKESREVLRRMRAGAKAERQPAGSAESRADADAQRSRTAAPRVADVADCVIVVTGLPRSGTSMMMQMLAAGGLPVLTDGAREADENNPRGYFEHAAVKRLATDAAWIAECRGRAVKVVSPLVRHLPRAATSPPYVIIHMQRPVAEVVASQRSMLARGGRPAAGASDALLIAGFEREAAITRAFAGQLAAEGRGWVLELDYHRCLADPMAAAGQLASLLGPGFDTAAAAAAVDRGLHRTTVA